MFYNIISAVYLLTIWSSHNLSSRFILSPRWWALCRCGHGLDGTRFHYFQKPGETSLHPHRTAWFTLAQWFLFFLMYLLEAITFNITTNSLFGTTLTTFWNRNLILFSFLSHQNQSLLVPFGSQRVKTQMTTRCFSSSVRQRLKPRGWESPPTLVLDSSAGWTTVSSLQY